MTLIVPDASVCAKLFIAEHDSEEANTFFSTCARTNTKLIAPDLLVYEVAESIRYCDAPLKKVFSVIENMRDSIMSISTPDNETWYLAEEITQQGHIKSGFPSMYDSIYHAMAIKLDAVFLTADKKHFTKTKQYGHIKLLEDWESIFIESE